MHFKSNPFDPFLRVTPKKIRTTAYAWLVENVQSHTDDSCLIWPFGKNKKGYGILSIKHKSVLAHRVAYELWTGNVSEKSIIQTCRDRLCVAPQHLQEHDNGLSPTKKPRKFERYEFVR